MVSDITPHAPSVLTFCSVNTQNPLLPKAITTCTKAVHSDYTRMGKPSRLPIASKDHTRIRLASVSRSSAFHAYLCAGVL